MIPHHLKKHFEILAKHNISLERLFVVPPTPVQEKFIRKYAPLIINALPVRYRYLFTDIMKKLRNPMGKLRLHYPSDFREYQRIHKEITHLQLCPWWGKRAVLCLSHDVDSEEGYRFVSRMVEMDAKYKIRSTFYFITHEYTIDNQLIRSLEHNNFEIGLHGYTHDQGVAFRKVNTIKHQVQRAIDALGVSRLVGYRSPALSISANLLRVLGDMNFLYDSTMQIASPFYYSVKIPYPYYLTQYKLWEIPLMIQDDNYLRDTKTNEQEILNSIRHFIEDTIALNGVFVVNIHPHLMVRNQDFYNTFLRFIAQFSEDLAYVPIKEVIRNGGNNYS